MRLRCDIQHATRTFARGSTLKRYTNSISRHQRFTETRATRTVVMHQIQTKSKNLDFVSSVLCGREKSLSLDIKMHPIFPLFPEGILSYHLDTFAQIYPQNHEYIQEENGEKMLCLTEGGTLDLHNSASRLRQPVQENCRLTLFLNTW